MNLNFKKCTDEDLDLLIEISIKTFKSAFEAHNDPKDFSEYLKNAFNVSSMQNQLKEKNTEFYIIYENKTLIAYIKLNKGKAQTETFDQPSIELERIYVLPQHIGKGYGRNILKQVLEMTHSQKASFLWLGVWEHNLDAIRFYESHGFVKFDEHPYYLGQDKQTDWLMKFEFQ